jgi:hypothetical protein
MMKKFTALLLAAMLLMPFALAETAPTQIPAATQIPQEVPAPVSQDKVLATVDNTQILQSQADSLMPTFVSYQYVSSETDYQTVVNYLVQQEVLRRKIIDMKFDQFTPEEETALRNDAQKELDGYLDQYVQYYLAEDTEEARAQTRQQAEEFYASRGVNLDVIVENNKYSAGVDRMREYLMGGYAPTDAEIQDVFNTVGQQYVEQYQGNVSLYEGMTQYYGQTSWYTPEGYRGIVHILLSVEPEVLEQYTAMQAAYEEQQQPAPEGEAAAEEPAEESVVTEPVTLEQVEQAKQAVLDSRKAVIDEIYDRLANGESFENLIVEFGEDPGMQDETNLQNGYMVHKDSILWDPAFTAGAFSDRMQKVGDYSDPVVGSHGIHILKYLRDVPSGLLMTDAIHDEIALYLTQNKENEVFDQAFKSWEETIAITYDTASIEQASKEAAERIAAQEAEEAEAASPALEAVPSEGGEAEATQVPAN